MIKLILLVDYRFVRCDTDFTVERIIKTGIEMKRNGTILLVAVLLALTATTTLAWLPDTWVYHTGAYAYSASEKEWYWFNSADTQWEVRLSNGVWGKLTNVTGWNYHTWPYMYANNTSSWHWFNTSDKQRCVKLSNGQWSLFGMLTPMVSVSGGTFTMGDTWKIGDADELPTHQVTVSSFLIDKYEVTNEDMRKVMQWAEDNLKVYTSTNTVFNSVGVYQELLDLDDEDSEISWNGHFEVDKGQENCPCSEVSWYGAAAYCNFRSEMEGLTPCYNQTTWACNWSANGYRLPTEAEWEYAAKGGANASYTKYSGSDNVNTVAWYNINSGSNSHVVGTKTPNEIYIYDMSGNLREWCADIYGGYSAFPSTNPHGPATGSSRVLRGGCWPYAAKYCRVANRGGSNPDNSSEFVGFRCVR